MFAPFRTAPGVCPRRTIVLSETGRIVPNAIAMQPGDTEATGPPPQPPATDLTGSRGFRLELLVGVLALVASAVASVATMIQTHTNGTQLSASVWPYLTVSKHFEAPRVRLGFVNQGLGPALVRTFSLSLDGRTQRRWADVAVRLDANRRFRVEAEHDFGGGSVLRPGEDVDLATIAGSAGTSQARMDAVFRRLRVTVCYCSLLDNCWTLDSHRVEPRPVVSCGGDSPVVTQ